MADLEVQPSWPKVREIGIELARGGPNGNMNEQAKALVARTELLMEQKASKSEIVQGVFEFGTYTEFNTVKATLPLNCTVIIGEANNTGTGNWGLGNNKWNGTTLSKSTYDPTSYSKNYTDLKTLDKIVGKLSQNLVNKAASGVAVGYFPNHTTGVLQANASYITTDYIPVTASLNYTVSVKHYWCWYDTNKIFISGTNDSNTSKTQVAPINAVYARLSAPNSAWPTFQLEKGLVSTPYAEYGISLDVNTIPFGSIDETKIKPKSITPETVNFLRLGKNLFNSATLTLGQLIDPSSGNFILSANYNSSDFISVLPDTKYVANCPLRTVAFYNKNKQLISGGINDSNLTTFSFNVPSNVFFIRVGVRSSESNVFQLELGEQSTSYEPYGYKAQTADGTPIFVAIDKIDGKIIVDGSIPTNKLNFITSSKNLFNKTSVTVGKFISGTTGTLTDNVAYDTSDFINVNPNTQYTSNKSMRFHAFFNSSKQFIGGGSDNSASTFTTNSNTQYIRITVPHGDLHTFQLENGTTATAFEPYGYLLKTPEGTPFFTESINTPSPSKWTGKSWASLGDSITAGQTWQGYVVSALGLTWTNFGIGGTKISGAVGDVNAMCQDTRINAIPTTVDLITLMGGTNDWAQNVPLGAIDSTDPTTFNGALNTFAQKAFARWPTKRIAVATTPYGEIPDWTGRAGWTGPSKNSLGLTTNDYAEAIRQFCKRANLVCTEVAQNAGYGTHNIVPAMGGSTTDNLHPAANSPAAKGIGGAHIKCLRDIEPI